MRNRISRNISIILRAERLIAHRHLAVLRRQTGFAVAALVVAGLGLIMLNVAAFFALSEEYSDATSALIVALINLVLAGLLVVLATKSNVDEEIKPVAEVRDLALEDLEAEIRMAAEEAKEAATALKTMAANPLASFGPGVASGIAKAIIKSMKD